MLGLVVLFLLYLAIILERWKVGRHYGEPMRLLGFHDLRECWEYTRFSPHCLWIRIIVVFWACAGVLLVISS